MSEGLGSFLLLAKQATGKALVSLIRQALVAPTIFTFTELLEMENTQKLSESEEANTVELLKLFSYGTYEEYKSRRTELPVLEVAELNKLKKLSLVSIAAESHNLSYAMLMERLDVATTRALEDLIIDAIYSSLVKAKLNTRTQSVYIESTAGRDLTPDHSLEEILRSLETWGQTCNSVLQEIQSAIETTKKTAELRRKEELDHGMALQEVHKRIGSQEKSKTSEGTSRSKRSAGFHTQLQDTVMHEGDGDGQWSGSAEGHLGNVSGSGRKRKTPSKVRN